MRTICRRGSRPSRPPPTSLLISSPPSRAGTLHASQEACFFTHTFLHFRCATQLSRAPRLRAQFSAYRDVNGVRGRAGVYMDLHETMIHASFVPSLHPSRVQLQLLFLLATFPLHRPFRASLRNPGPRRPSFLASPPYSSAHSHHAFPPFLTACPWLLLICPPRAPLFHPPIPTPPCSFHLLFGLYSPACMTLTPSLPSALRQLQHHLFLHHHHLRPRRASSAVPHHEHHDVAHEDLPEARAQHYEDYDERFVLKHHCTIGPFSAAPLTLARATHCGGSGYFLGGG
ncbi:hypothetical protein C8R45DRAFT_545369 [Mycena sanguinolenta]|nr:hypothetical protein C8R45DRAFT_545369 [Mycena sanguinolenta]